MAWQGRARLGVARLGRARDFFSEATMSSRAIREIVLSLDLDGIEPGTEIDRNRCEALLAGRYIDRYDYQQQLLQLGSELERELRRRGKTVTVRRCKFYLQVLSDSASLKFNSNAFSLHKRAMSRDHKRLLAVNPVNLSDEEREAHEKALARQAMILSSMRKRQSITELLTPTIRSVPVVGG